MARIATSKGERTDVRPPTRVGQVPRYPGQPGILGAAAGIQPTPQAPGAGRGSDQRARLLQLLKSGRGKQTGLRGRYLQQLQGGGTPQGPLYQGYLSELVRSLLAGA